MTKAIKFYADWCGPCKSYNSEWEKVVTELKDENIEFININVDKDETGLAAKYKVRSIPCTVILQDSKVKQQTGLLTASQLKTLILS